MRRWRSAAALAGQMALMALMALVAAGCGGGEDRSKAQLRFVNASTGYAALDLVVDDVSLYSSVPYGQQPAYAEVDPARNSTRVSTPGSPTALVSLTPALTKQRHYTLLGYGRAGALATVLIEEEQTAPDSGKALVRVINAAPDAGVLDVYLTAATDPLTGAVPTQASAAVGASGAFATLNAGTWRLRVTRAGDRDDLRLDRSDIVLDSRAVTTLVLTPASGGVLVNALWLAQQGAIAPAPVQHARVRVAAGLPSAGTVSATVGGVALLGGAASPAIGAYRLVPAGDQPVALTIDGAPWPAASRSLGAGSEHTLLIHDIAGTVSASWIDDDNRPPLSASRVRLRLIHGMAGTTGVISMTIDRLPVAGGVAAGTASVPADVDAGSGLDLSVNALGIGAPVFEALDRTLSAGGVYSVFVLGGPAPATGVLRQDR